MKNGWWFGKAKRAADKALADAQARIAELKMDVRRREELLEVRDRTIEGLKADLEGTEKEMRKYREDMERWRIMFENWWSSSPQKHVSDALVKLEKAAINLGLDDDLLARNWQHAGERDVEYDITRHLGGFDYDAKYDGPEGERNKARFALCDAALDLVLALGNKRTLGVLARSEEDVRLYRSAVERERRKASADGTAAAGEVA